MDKKIFIKKVILKYVLDNLKWHKRDGLMTYVDQLKYKQFKENREEHLQNLEVVNFDLIHKRCRKTPLTNPESFYKTVKKTDVKNFPKNEK